MNSLSNNITIRNTRDGYIVGNADTGVFLILPLVAILILEGLSKGKSHAEIFVYIKSQTGEGVNIDEFLQDIVDAGLLSRSEGISIHIDSHRDRRNLIVAKTVSIVSLIILTLLIPIYIYYIYPRYITLGKHVFYFDSGAFFGLLLVMIIQVIRIVLHETAHVGVARLFNINGNISVSNRLWFPVIETDLSEILLLKRQHRLYPILSGIYIDLIFGTGLIAAGLSQFIGSSYLDQVFIAAGVTSFLAIAWQFNVFMKTDIYLLLCVMFDNYNLEEDAKKYLKNHVRNLFNYGYPAIAPIVGRRNTSVLLFLFVWIIGRSVALVFFFFVLLPTDIGYITVGVKDFFLRSSPRMFAADKLGAGILTLAPTILGLFLWWKAARKSRQKEGRVHDHVEI